MNQDRQLEFDREFDVSAKNSIFGIRHVVIANFTDGHDAFLMQITRQHLEHAFGKFGVVRFFGIQTQCAEVLDAELRGSEALPAQQRQKVVLERTHVSAWLTQPKRRFDDRRDTRFGHGLVVVRRTGRHVDVGGRTVSCCLL